MKARLACRAVVLIALTAGCSEEPTGAGPVGGDDVEARIIRYLGDNLAPGEAVVVSELSGEIFSSPEEQAALDRLFDAFFRIPLFLVQFNSGTGEIPTLREISQQFNFSAPGQADVMLRIMESDPRIPRFFERDPESGEIMSLDVDLIVNHPQFGQEIERTLAGWTGRALPGFAMETFDGAEINSLDLAGRPYMVYVWFSNCPPCVATSPLLVDLYATYADTGFEIIAANADRILELPYDDQVRTDYVEEAEFRFPATHLTDEVQSAFGGVTVFPTMFFVDREGVVVRHFMNFQEESVLDEAIQATL